MFLIFRLKNRHYNAYSLLERKRQIMNTYKKLNFDILNENMSTDRIEWLDELRKENEKSSQIRE